MAADPGSDRGGSVFSLDVRQIVIAGILGGIAIFSWLDPVVPPLRNPLVSILPRIPIGIVSWMVFVSLRRTSVDLASVVAGLLGSFTNTVGVVGMAVLLGYFPL